MLVISAGMQKSGSGWYFNLTNDLLIASGKQDVRSIRRKFRLGFLAGENCQIGNARLYKLYQLPSEAPCSALDISALQRLLTIAWNQWSAVLDRAIGITTTVSTTLSGKYIGCEDS